MNPAGEGRNAEQMDKDERRRWTADLLIAMGIGEREAEMRGFQKLRQRPRESSGDVADAGESWTAMPQSGRMFQVSRLEDDEDPGGDDLPPDDLDELSFF